MNVLKSESAMLQWNKETQVHVILQGQIIFKFASNIRESKNY